MPQNTDTTYCYPGTNVLKNKMKIKDKDLLKSAERQITSVKIAKVESGKWIKGDFDLKHLQKMHKHIFGDIYDWAGQLRTVNIAKGEMFCRPEFMEDQLNDIFRKLKKENYLKDSKTMEQVGERLGYYHGEINAVHPFREGNGRSTRMFISHLANTLGYNLDFSKIKPEEMIAASKASFYCNHEPIQKLITSALEPKEKKLRRLPKQPIQTQTQPETDYDYT